MYIDKLDDIMNEYSSTRYRTIKMKPVDPKTYIDFNKENYKKILNLKLMFI